MRAGSTSKLSGGSGGKVGGAPSDLPPGNTRSVLRIGIEDSPKNPDETGQECLEFRSTFSLYTDNTSCFNGNRLEQEPLHPVRADVGCRELPEPWVAAATAEAQPDAQLQKAADGPRRFAR